MWKKLLTLAALGMTALVVTLSPASAQATRTWVSGVGDDANPCSRTAPCKTWAGAISKTANGGEIDALDPGGFGALTITKSITIDGGGGQVASVLVAGTNGFVVAAQPTDVVIIKNVRIQGLLGNGSNSANAGINAIRFISGSKLIVENCEIYGFNANGIDIANSTAGNSTAINNTQIMNVANAGVLVEAVGTAAQVQIDNSRMYKTKFGVAIATGNTVVMSKSTSSFASSAGVEADGGATLALDENVITFNTNGISGGGTIQSFNNNRLFGNASNGVTPSKIGSQSDPFGME
jgi:hypothetical protein